MGVPRLCGDGPTYEVKAYELYRRSPPVRGWPDMGYNLSEIDAAFPACAGMARHLTT